VLEPLLDPALPAPPCSLVPCEEVPWEVVPPEPVPVLVSDPLPPGWPGWPALDSPWAKAIPGNAASASAADVTAIAVFTKCLRAWIERSLS
jgi:hypothetical protein